MIPVVAQQYRDFTYWLHREHLRRADYRHVRDPEDLAGYRGEVVHLIRVGHELRARRTEYGPKGED